jgi:hypothetical protein
MLAYGWIHQFLTRHQNMIGCVKVYPQDDPRLQIPRAFLGQYLAIVQQYIGGVNRRLVDTIDETGCSDWEKRRAHDGIVQAALKDTRLHFPMISRVKHQMMFVCITTAGETLCPLIVTTN